MYIFGQPVLRKTAEEIDFKDYPNLKELITNMFETLERSEGVGLAAPQVGLPIRLFIVDYVAKEDVSVIVVGKPTQMNGEDSENMKRIEPFFNRLKKLFPEKEITYYDERFTSVLAHQTMLQSGIGKKARQNKALVDKISATIILEDYMQRNGKW